MAHLKLAIDGEVEGQSPEVEREQMSLGVIEAGVRRAETVLHLLDAWRYFGGVETHTTGNISVNVTGDLDVISYWKLKCYVNRVDLDSKNIMIHIN